MDEWQMANTRKHVPLTQLHDWVGIYLCNIRTQVIAQQLEILKTIKTLNAVKLITLTMDPFHCRVHLNKDRCYNQFPQIQGGGPKEPDLAQLLGWALSHWGSDSLMDRFTGVLMMRF